MKLGIMGGTFDPVHNGHLIAAEEARAACGLDEVVFVPAGHPWQKAERQVSSGEDRYLMTELATVTNPAFSVSRIELDRDGPTYTVDTLRALSGPELWFISGADAVAQILTWKDPEEVLSLATFVAATRPGHRTEGLDPRVRVLEIPALAISSTEIRQRVREARPVRYLVPDAVAAFIAKRGLYR